MTMPPFDWTKHRAAMEAKASIASSSGAAPSRTIEVPLEVPTTKSNDEGEAPTARASVNGFVLRRMQRMASDRWSRPSLEGAAPQPQPTIAAQTALGLGRAPPRRCVSNEEQVFARLEQLRRNSDDSTDSNGSSNRDNNRRKKLNKTKSAMQMVNRTSHGGTTSSGEANKKKDETPKRIPRRSISSSSAAATPRGSILDMSSEQRRSIRRTVSSSSKRSHRKSQHGAPKQPQRALSPIPRKQKNSVAPIAA